MNTISISIHTPTYGKKKITALLRLIMPQQQNKRMCIKNIYEYIYIYKKRFTQQGQDSEEIEATNILRLITKNKGLHKQRNKARK